MNRMTIQIVLWIGLFSALAPQVSKANDHAPPSSLTLASPTLEIGFPAQRSLIQFFYVQKVEDEPDLEIYLSYRSAGEMRTVHLETLGPEGRAAEVATVFTLDADGDRTGELFIVAAWPIGHASIGTDGTYYRVYVYRKSVTDDGGIEFQRARDIEDRLGSGFDGRREGAMVSFPYKDYESIRAAVIP